jgi:orotate phosphoribosyltransferase
MDDRARLLQLLRENALRRGRVRLSSGLESDFYIDCKQVSLDPEGLALYGRLALAEVEALPARVVAAGGMTLGADPLAAAVALTSHLLGRPLAAFIVRKEPKSHGTRAWIEGTNALRPRAPVAILEDVLTTGASTLRASERAREADLVVAGVVVLVDREEEGGRERVEREAGVPVRSLFRRRDVLGEDSR